MLSKESNIDAGLAFTKYSPQQTCFAQEPSTCSPYLINNFNVKVGSNNIYTSKMDYRFDQYLLELDGAQGVNANTETGFTSGQINLKDYNRNFGYIVCDLSRRTLADVDVSTSIEISGTVASPKSIDLLCYLTVQRQIIIDIATGGILQQ